VLHSSLTWLQVPGSFTGSSNLLDRSNQSEYPPEIMAPFDRLRASYFRLRDGPAPPLTQNDDALQRDMIWTWWLAKPDKREERKVDGLMQRLTNIVNRHLGGPLAAKRANDRSLLPRFQVDLFGSTAWGGRTGSGDIDLIIRVSLLRLVDAEADGAGP
jgi:hypothetical protein